MKKVLDEQVILQLILDELQGKKEFQPFRATSCDFCLDDIEESDDFYFMEGKRKICSECFFEVIDYLEIKQKEI